MYQRRKTTKILSLRSEARKKTPPAPRHFYPRAGGQVLCATARDVRLQASACISGWYKQDVSVPGLFMKTWCALWGRGRRALTFPLPALGPRPTTSPPPADSARLEIPRPHSHVRTPPGPPSPAPRSRSPPGCPTREDRERRPRLQPAPGSATLALSPQPPKAPPPPLRDTHHFRVRLSPGAPGGGAGPDPEACSLSGQPLRAPACARPGRRKGRRVGD